jgi:hypothetical protein
MTIFHMQTGSGGGGEPRDVVGGRLEKASATSLEWQPYHHNCIGLYDGSNWVVVTPSSTPSLANSANDIDSAALAINYNYDIYAEYSSLTALNLVAKKWTNDTIRSVTPARWEGVLCYDNSTTAGKKRRWLGTIRMLSSSGAKFEDTENIRYISNYYNRIRKILSGNNSTSSWTYGTASWREFNNGSGQTKGYVVFCSAQSLDVSLYATVQVHTSSCYVGVGVDGSISGAAVGYTSGGLGYFMISTHNATYPYSVGIGYHYLSQHEYGQQYQSGKYAVDALQQSSTNKVWTLIEA